jgi:hypothetical protein
MPDDHDLRRLLSGETDGALERVNRGEISTVGRSSSRVGGGTSATRASAEDEASPVRDQQHLDPAPVQVQTAQRQAAQQLAHSQQALDRTRRTARAPRPRSRVPPLAQSRRSMPVRSAAVMPVRTSLSCSSRLGLLRTLAHSSSWFGCSCARRPRAPLRPAARSWSLTRRRRSTRGHHAAPSPRRTRRRRRRRRRGGRHGPDHSRLEQGSAKGRALVSERSRHSRPPVFLFPVGVGCAGREARRTRSVDRLMSIPLVTRIRSLAVAG